jgi:hypothetical protein
MRDPDHRDVTQGELGGHSKERGKVDGVSVKVSSDNSLTDDYINIDDANDADVNDNDYTYVDVDNILRNAGKVVMSIPSDGDVSKFTVEQMSLLLNQLNAPFDTVRDWSRLRIDGQRFAAMSNSQLANYKLLKPLIVYFRDHSQKRL